MKSIMYVCEVRSCTLHITQIMTKSHHTQDPSEASIFARTNTSPFIVVEGTITQQKQWYILCEKRMVTYKVDADETLVVSLITLISVYYLEYRKDVFLALTFLQEKLTSTPVTVKTKTHYNNLFRSINLFEQVSESEDQA